MASWHYRVGEEQKGPVSTTELKQLVQAGEIGPEDLIWREGLAEWVPAGKAKGLFPAAGTAPAKVASSGKVAPAMNAVRPAMKTAAVKPVIAKVPEAKPLAEPDDLPNLNDMDDLPEFAEAPLASPVVSRPKAEAAAPKPKSKKRAAAAVGGGNKRIVQITVAVVLLIAAGGAVWYFFFNEPTTPTEVARAFVDAVDAGNGSRAAHLVAGTEAQQAAYAAIIDLGYDQKKLQEAAARKWPAEAGRMVTGLPPKAKIGPNAREEIKGDTALVYASEPSGASSLPAAMPLKKFDGKWRIDLGMTGMESIPTADLEKMKQIFADITSDINGGKFHSYQEMQTAMQQKLAAVGPRR